MHCWGGHGRTGTIIAVMLGRMYDVTTAQALARTQQLHDVRGDPQNVGSPSTPVQVAQVRRLLARAENEKQTPPSAAAAATAARLKAERVEKTRRRDLEREEAIARAHRRAVEKRAEVARARSYSGVSSPRTPVLAGDTPTRRWREEARRVILLLAIVREEMSCVVVLSCIRNIRSSVRYAPYGSIV